MSKLKVQNPNFKLNSSDTAERKLEVRGLRQGNGKVQMPNDKKSITSTDTKQEHER
jgi:hypothetical protein